MQSHERRRQLEFDVIRARDHHRVLELVAVLEELSEAPRSVIELGGRQFLVGVQPLEDGEEAQAGSVNRLLGAMKASGIKPQFLSKLGENGVHLPPQFFQLEPDRGAVTPVRPTAFGRTSA